LESFLSNWVTIIGSCLSIILTVLTIRLTLLKLHSHPSPTTNKSPQSPSPVQPSPSPNSPSQYLSLRELTRIMREAQRAGNIYTNFFALFAVMAFILPFVPLTWAIITSSLSADQVGSYVGTGLFLMLVCVIIATVCVAIQSTVKNNIIKAKTYGEFHNVQELQ
jgi:hypothetical protein